MDSETETSRLNDSLAWEERPFRALMKLAWPITLSTLSYSLMTLVDTLLVSHLGKAQLAGVGLGGTAAFALLCFSFGLIRGTKTLVAQAVGAGRRQEIGAYLGAALLAAGAIGVFTVLVGQVISVFIGHLAATDAAATAAETYFRIRILGAPMALLYVALREVRYAQGDARTPMIATVVANVVNIGLAYLLVFHFRLGVAGAGWGTVVAQAVEAGIAASVQHVRGWNVRRMRIRHVVELWRIGLPTGLQFTLEVGAFTLLATMISSLSEVQMAAHQIALQVTYFSFLPAFAVAEAASILGGQAVGANRDDLVLRVARYSLALAAGYTAACSIVVAAGAHLIAAGFGADEALAAVAVKLLYVAAVFQVFDGANIVARAVLRGAGDVRFAAVVGVVTSWVFTPPLTWFLGYRLGLGAFGGWLGLLAEIVSGAFVLWWRLERRTWKGAADAARARLAAAAALPREPSSDEAPVIDASAIPASISAG